MPTLRVIQDDVAWVSPTSELPKNLKHIVTSYVVRLRKGGGHFSASRETFNRFLFFAFRKHTRLIAYTQHKLAKVVSSKDVNGGSVSFRAARAPKPFYPMGPNSRERTLFYAHQLVTVTYPDQICAARSSIE